MDVLPSLILQPVPVATVSEGIIQIEPGIWQTISIPSVYGYWDVGTSQLLRGVSVARVNEYVIDQLVAKYGAGCVERISALWGDIGDWRDFIPGVTNPSTEENFELMPLDPQSGQREPLGILVKSSYGSNMSLEWKSWLT